MERGTVLIDVWQKRLFLLSSAQQPLSTMDEADAPSFLRRSKSKSLRGGREPSSSKVADDAGDDVTMAATLRHKQKARAKPKARLSFGGDEEVILFSKFYSPGRVDSDEGRRRRFQGEEVEP